MFMPNFSNMPTMPTMPKMSNIPEQSKETHYTILGISPTASTEE